MHEGQAIRTVCDKNKRSRKGPPHTSNPQPLDAHEVSPLADLTNRLGFGKRVVLVVVGCDGSTLEPLGQFST